MSGTEFAGKSTVIFWAHSRLEIIGYWMDNRKRDADIKQGLGEDYCRDEEEMETCVWLKDDATSVLQFYTRYSESAMSSFLWVSCMTQMITHIHATS